MESSSLSNTTKVVMAFVVFALLAIGWSIAVRPTGPDISSYYPLEVGNAWSYKATQRGIVTGAMELPETIQVSTIEQRVVGPSPLFSEETEVFEVSETVVPPPGPDGAPGKPVESTLYLSATRNAILLHVPGDDGLPDAVPILDDPPTTEPLTTERGTLSMSLRVQSQEVDPIEVPAGSFPSALKRHTKGTVSGYIDEIPINSGAVEEITWFARDVGMVRQIRTLEYTLEAQEGAAVRVEEIVDRLLVSFSRSGAD